MIDLIVVLFSLTCIIILERSVRNIDSRTFKLKKKIERIESDIRQLEERFRQLDELIKVMHEPPEIKVWSAPITKEYF